MPQPGNKISDQSATPGRARQLRSSARAQWLHLLPRSFHGEQQWVSNPSPPPRSSFYVGPISVSLLQFTSTTSGGGTTGKRRYTAFSTWSRWWHLLWRKARLRSIAMQVRIRLTLHDENIIYSFHHGSLWTHPSYEYELPEPSLNFD